MLKVENLCKTLLKTVCKFCVQFCGILKTSKLCVENHIFTHISLILSTHFSTSNSPLFIERVFHFSTKPTITINIYK